MLQPIKCRKKNNLKYLIYPVIIFLLLFSSAVAVAGESGELSNSENIIRSPFADISKDNLYYPYANFLHSRSILSGFPDRTFRPDASLTRSQVAVTLVKALGLNDSPEPSGSPAFLDVPASHWAHQYIQAAAGAGLLRGDPDGKFRPDDYITRAESAVLLFKYANEPADKFSSVRLADVTGAHWAYNYIASCVDAKFIPPGEEGKFSPDRAMSRADWARGLSLSINSKPAISQVPLPALLITRQAGVQLKTGAKTITPSPNQEVKVNLNDTIATNSGVAELIFSDGTGLKLESNTEISIVKSQGFTYLMRDGSQGVGVDDLFVKLVKGKVLFFLASKYTSKVASLNKEAAPNYSPALVASNQEFYELLAAGQPAKNNLPWYKTAGSKRVRLKVEMPWGVAAVRGSTGFAEADSNNSILVNAEGSMTFETPGGNLHEVPSGKALASSSGGARLSAMNAEQKQYIVNNKYFIRECIERHFETLPLVEDEDQQQEPAEPTDNQVDRELETVIGPTPREGSTGTTSGGSGGGGGGGTLPVKVTGKAIDSSVTMAPGNRTIFPGDNSWTLTIATGTVAQNMDKHDLIITNLPDGLSFNAGKGEGNIIIIALSGSVVQEVYSLWNVNIVVKGSAVAETGASDSDPINVFINPARPRVAGTATDSTVTMGPGNTSVSVSDNTWSIEVTGGTVSPGVSGEDLIITNLPDGLSFSAAKEGANNVLITVAGAVAEAVYSPVPVGIVVKGSAVIEPGALDSQPVSAYINPSGFQSLNTVGLSTAIMANRYKVLTGKGFYTEAA